MLHTYRADSSSDFFPILKQTVKRNDLEFYNQVAADWWYPQSQIYALHHLNPLRFAYFDRYIPHWQGLRVLDLGCGGGYTCEFLAARGAVVSGLDQAEACISAAQIHAAAQSLKIEYLQGFAEAIPWADASFDVVICVDVLEHVSNISQVMHEIRRVLKPQGYFCFDTINRTWQSRLIMIWLLENTLKLIPQGIHDWQKFVPTAELIERLQHLNFSQIEIKGFQLFGKTLFDYIAAYRHYQKTGGFQVQFDQDTSVMYIGTARRL